MFLALGAGIGQILLLPVFDLLVHLLEFLFEFILLLLELVFQHLLFLFVPVLLIIRYFVIKDGSKYMDLVVKQSESVVEI